MKATFRSLAEPNFRLYFVGQLISVTGTWMQSLALSWLIWRLTKSPMMLGFVDAARLSPIFLFALIGGNIADKFDRRKIVLITQILALLQASTLAVLTLGGWIRPWQAIALAFFAGTVNAFELPARQAFLSGLVKREDMMNAISLSSTVMSLARSIGPALAGLLVTTIGEGGCFAINAASYVATISAVLAMKLAPKAVPDERDQATSPRKSFAVDTKEALIFAFTHGDIKRVLLQGMTLSIFGLQYTVLFPVYAARVLHGDAVTLGFLRAASGAGALFAALRLASHTGDRAALALSLGLAAAGFSVSLFAFSCSTNFGLSLALVFCLGYCMTSLMSGGNSLVQISVPDALRGRVMSIYVTVMMGIAPVGSCLYGLGGARIGCHSVTKFCAVACFLTGLVYIGSLLLKRAKEVEDAPGPAKLL